MGRNRKKGGAGAVATAADNAATVDEITGRSYNNTEDDQRILAAFLDTVRPQVLDQAFNRGRASVQFADDIKESLAKDDLSTESEYERDTGFRSASEQDVYDYFIGDIRAAQRPDGSWDTKALREIATANFDGYADEYAYSDFDSTEAAAAMRETQRTIRYYLAAANASAKGYLIDFDNSRVYLGRSTNRPSVDIETIANLMYPQE